jgi:hypothetical protein
MTPAALARRVFRGRGAVGGIAVRTLLQPLRGGRRSAKIHDVSHRGEPLVAGESGEGSCICSTVIFPDRSKACVGGIHGDTKQRLANSLVEAQVAFRAAWGALKDGTVPDELGVRT